MPSVSSVRRPVWFLVVLVAIAVVVVWYLRRGPCGAAAEAPVPEPAVSRPVAATRVGHAIEAQASQDAAATQRSDARAKRDALREQILRQLAQRPAAADLGSAPGPAAPAAGSSNRPGDPPPGGLRNRIGDSHQAVVDQLNHDFMPLAKECVDQAQQRTPITGLIELSMEAIADEQLGAVVDAAEPAPTNQVVDPLLFECLRESAFSLTLPPPPTGGRMKILITLRMDDPASGSGSGRPWRGAAAGWRSIPRRLP